MKPNEKPNPNSKSSNATQDSKKADSKARQELKKTGEEAKQAATEAFEETKQAASETMDEAKQKSRELAREARQRAENAIERQQKAAAVQVSGIADALHKSAGNVPEEQAWLASGMHKAGDFMDTMSDSLQKRSVSDLMHDLERYTQRQPGVVIGAAAVAGFMLARFLKSSNPATAAPNTTSPNQGGHS